MRTDGRTDRHDEAVDFRHLGNASNKMITRHTSLTARGDELFLVCTRMSYIRNENPLGLCHGLGGQSPASHRGGPASTPGQSVWDL